MKRDHALQMKTLGSTPFWHRILGKSMVLQY